MKEIIVNQEGYNQFFEEFEKLTNSLTVNASSGSEAYADAVGDGWHDNFAYEEIMRQEKIIQNKISEMRKQKDNLVVIDEEEYIDDIVNINDIIEVEIKYADDDIEQETFKLTGKFFPDASNKEISLNSPIGKAIYNKKIGSTVDYKVGENTIEVFIIKKN